MKWWLDHCRHSVVLYRSARCNAVYYSPLSISVPTNTRSLYPWSYSFLVTFVMQNFAPFLPTESFDACTVFTKPGIYVPYLARRSFALCRRVSFTNILLSLGPVLTSILPVLKTVPPHVRHEPQINEPGSEDTSSRIRRAVTMEKIRGLELNPICTSIRRTVLRKHYGRLPWFPTASELRGYPEGLKTP